MTLAEYIAGWEGYSGVAYWDVNHWRIGFGSDTEGPDQIEVVEGMTTTRPRALQNLAIRIPQFQNVAAKAMGVDVWASLPDHQRIAITSLVYNYGRLPIKIYTSDPEKTAAAIAGLQGANGGVNRKRRLGEAAFFLGGNVHEQPSHKPVAVGAGLTGTAAALVAFYTWVTEISGTERILVSIVVLETLLVFYLVNRLLHKMPDVIIHPLPALTELELVTRLKQAKARQAAVAASLADAAQEVENTKQELKKTVENLQLEIEL